MNVFGKYSNIYDLFYEDKDYKAEVAYVDRLIKQYKPGAKNLLDLGCGTGRHDIFFLKHGYNVCGVDSSREMLQIARKRKQNDKLAFINGDVRTIRLKRIFDVVVSLFHVLSYQLSNDDLMDTFKTVREHLNKGGIFIFDFWYGPAVLTNRPCVRVKKIEKNGIQAVKVAEPYIHPNENIVDVNYYILLRDKNRKKFEEINELHRLRYLFMPEILFMLKNAHFETKTSLQWLSFNKKLNFDSWYGVVIAEAK